MKTATIARPEASETKPFSYPHKSWADQLLTRADFKACGRCGIERRYKTGRINICRDCRDILSEAERELWK